MQARHSLLLWAGLHHVKEAARIGKRACRSSLLWLPSSRSCWQLFRHRISSLRASATQVRACTPGSAARVSAAFCVADSSR